MSLEVSIEAQRFEIAGGFRISRETRTHAQVVVVTLSDGKATGHGESVPYPRYGESLETVQTQIEEIAPAAAATKGKNFCGYRLRQGGPGFAIAFP